MMPVNHLQSKNEPGGNGSDMMGSILWNGRDSHGRIVANGVYFYRVTINNDDPFWGKVLIVR
jgi:hypothetical protein